MPGIGRHILTRKLKEALARLRCDRGLPQAAVGAEQNLRSLTRRQLLAGAVVATAGLELCRPLHAVTSAVDSRIVVVGAGLAGLRFAHSMWTERGIASSVYEAGDRLGGRVWSNRSYFAEGQVAEHGAEFISSEHSSMLRLAQHLGLQLAVVYGGSEPGGSDVCWLDDAYYTMDELNADLKQLEPALVAANQAAPFPTLYNDYTKAGYELDHTSAIEWLDQNCPDGASSKLGRVLQTALLTEYGGEPGVQSALNLIYLINGPGTNGLSGTDEKYHIIGGNDQVPARMAEQLPQGSIQAGMWLIALNRNADGSYTCTFQRDASIVDVPADHVVLALPFNKLKKVDLSRAGFSQVKMNAINNYALGTNAKLALQFHTRPWLNPDHWSGVCYTGPENFQLSWDATVSQKGPAGILQRFPGGDDGGPHAFPGAAAHGVAPAEFAQQFLAAIESPFPGCQAAYNGRAWLDWWDKDPFIEGAYGCYRVGDYTSFAGVENKKQGNVHFCGEQTDMAFQGFMEGAVRSAERLAKNWPKL